ncbi:MAG TPA: hypothetical protein VHX88_08495 [Solirubrobacteraceae bacterium]|nr:hypothetical protein [Solirubrobacteraceae bacterium]
MSDYGDRMDLPVVIVHPNRDKPAARTTRLIVIVLLLVSVALQALITVGGWPALQGSKPEEIVCILLYLLMAIFAVRWSRGVLPVSASLAIVLAIFAVVAAPAWFDRSRTGFASAALSANLLGALTVALIPVQVLLIAFATKGFQQGWNVEVEHRIAPGEAAPA